MQSPENEAAVRACLFDMGNVLLMFSHARMCRQIADLCGTEESSVRQFLFADGLQQDAECGRISETEFRQRLEEHFSVALAAEDVFRASADIFRLNEPMVPLLENLRTAGVRLVLLSNTSSAHLRFIRQNFDVLNRFDAFTTSFEVGAMKPDPAIFRDALARAGCAPEECFYTDDIAEYVSAARGFGIRAEVFQDAEATRAALHGLGVPLPRS